MTIRASSIRQIGLNQPAAPSLRPVPVANRSTVVPGAIPRNIQVQQDPTSRIVGQGFSALSQFIQRVDERRDKIETLRFGTALEQQLAGLETQVLQEVDKPSDAPREFLQRHQQITEALLDQVEDQDVRLLLEARAGRARAQGFAGVVKQVDAEQKRVLRDETNAQIELFRQRAVEAQTEEARDSFIGRIEALTDDQQAEGIITETEAVLQKREVLRQVDAARALRLIEADAASAVDALSPNAGVFPNLDTETRIRLRKQAERVVESNRRALVSDIGGLVEDDLASRRATGEGIEDMEAQVRALGDPELVEEYLEQRDLAESDHEFTVNLQFAPQEEILADLETARPEPGTEGFADKQKRFESMQKAARKMLGARAEDPAAFAAQDPGVAQRQQQAQENPALIESTVDSSLSVQASMGIAPSARRVLTNSQAEAMIADIDASSPVERATKVREVLAPFGKHQRQAMVELQNEGLNPQTLGLLNVVFDPLLSSMMAEGQSVGRTELRNGMPEDFDFETFRANVQDELAPLQRSIESVPGRIASYNQTILDPVIDMALVAERRGLDFTEVTDRYLDQFVIFDTFYIPKQIEGTPVDVAAVEAATESQLREEVIRDFRPSMFGGALTAGLSTEAAMDAIVSAAVNNGFWATNGRGDRLVFMIRLNDGSSVSLVNDAGERFEIDILNPPVSPKVGDIEIEVLGPFGS